MKAKKLVKHKSEFIFNVISWITSLCSFLRIKKFRIFRDTREKKNNFLCLLTTKLININFFLFFTFIFASLTQIIAMDDMKVRIAGTMKNIKDIDPKIIREWDAAIAKENAKER